MAKNIYKATFSKTRIICISTERKVMSCLKFLRCSQFSRSVLLGLWLSPLDIYQLFYPEDVGRRLVLNVLENRKSLSKYGSFIHSGAVTENINLRNYKFSHYYVVGSKSFRPDIQNRAKWKMLWGIYSAIYGEVNVSVLGVLK